MDSSNSKKISNSNNSKMNKTKSKVGKYTFYGSPILDGPEKVNL